VADAFVAGRQCTLSIPEIAARAGVGQTKARLALRIAQNLDLVSITERRVPYRPNRTNVVRIISQSWLGWLARWKPRSKVAKALAAEPAAFLASGSPGFQPTRAVEGGGGFTFERPTESRVYGRREERLHNLEVRSRPSRPDGTPEPCPASGSRPANPRNMRTTPG
jgi:hypothetical protein